MDDFQIWLNWGGGIALSALGWFARQIWSAVFTLKQDLEEIRLDMAKNYVPKEDYKESIKEIKEMFNIIREKLDAKADKER